MSLKVTANFIFENDPHTIFHPFVHQTWSWFGCEREMCLFSAFVAKALDYDYCLYGINGIPTAGWWGSVRQFLAEISSENVHINLFLLRSWHILQR